MTIVSTAEPNWPPGPPDWWLRYHGTGGRTTEGGGQKGGSVTIRCAVLHTTDKAIQIRAGSTTCWLPLSQTEIVEGGVRIARWLADKNGLAP